MLTSDPTKVYFITQYTQPPSTVVVSPAIPDAAGNPTSGIQALSGSGMGSFFTAVAPQAGAFGDAGSGISLGIITTTTQTGEIAPAAVATPVDRTSSLVATSTALPLATLDNPLLYTSYYIKKHMGEDEYVGTLFAGFHAVSGSDVSSTVRAVVSSYTQIGASFLALQPIVAVSALGTDSIIGAAAPDTEVTIHQLATLFPSIGTQYLVVVGGVGPDNTDPVNVYAMPLTSQGQLASINQPPLTIYSASIFFDQRQFVTPATSPSDLYTSTDTPAIVGGGSAPGAITGLFTTGDSVCISVVNAETGFASGIFYSQALFDNDLRICGWTPWQRALYPATISSFVAFDNTLNIFWYGNTLGGEEHSIVRTGWQQGTTQLSQAVAEQFPPAQGGLQGVCDIPYSSCLISTASYNAFAILTGNKAVAFAQTAQVVDNQLAPQIGWQTVVRCADGNLNNLTTPAQFVYSAGGALNDLGPIITAAATFTDVNWILVGGNGGLAVLAEADGSGIPLQSIGGGFLGLSTTLSWRQLGNYTNVRKIVTDGASIYVLTDTTLERFTISQDVVSGAVAFTAVRLATAEQLLTGPYSFFSDIVISGPLAILATSSGLLRSSSAIGSATSQDNVGWTTITMPESTGVATRLLPITITGKPSGLFNATSPGNLYVLSADPGNNQARIYRYVVTYGTGSIDTNTVQLFDDEFIKNRPTFLIDIGTYRNYFYTDGVLWSTSRSKYIEQPLFAQAFPPNFKDGMKPKMSDTPGFFTSLTNSIGAIQRISGLGAWVIPGDFGLVVHQ